MSEDVDQAAERVAYIEALHTTGSEMWWASEVAFGPGRERLLRPALGRGLWAGLAGSVMVSPGCGRGDGPHSGGGAG